MIASLRGQKMRRRSAAGASQKVSMAMVTTRDIASYSLIRRPLPMRYGTLILALMLALSGSAFAESPTNIDVTIKDHRFTPSEIHVPIGKPTMLTIKNEDSTAEEF